MIWRLALLVFALGFVPIPVHAATAPGFAILDGSVREGYSYRPLIQKDYAARSYSKIIVTIADGTAKAGVDYVRPAPLTITFGNKQLTALGPTIQTIDNAKSDGKRTVVATITRVRNAVITRSTATITIVDDEPATKVCPDGSVIASSSSCPPLPQWISAPLADGGYGRALNACAQAYWGRAAVKGEIVAVMVGGAGFRPWPGGDGAAQRLVLALSDKEPLWLPITCIEGVTPASGFTPPPLPANIASWRK